jgi:hypothetical protein
MTDPLGALVLKERKHEIIIADITLVDGESLFLGVLLTKEFQVRLLDTDIVVIVHFVNDNNVISTREKILSNAVANESSSSSDENFLVANVRLNWSLTVLMGVFWNERDSTSRPMHGARSILAFSIAGIFRALVVARTEHGHTCDVGKFHFNYFFGMSKIVLKAGFLLITKERATEAAVSKSVENP